MPEDEKLAVPTTGFVSVIVPNRTVSTFSANFGITTSPSSVSAGKSTACAVRPAVAAATPATSLLQNRMIEPPGTSVSARLLVTVEAEMLQVKPPPTP